MIRFFSIRKPSFWTWSYFNILKHIYLRVTIVIFNVYTYEYIRIIGKKWHVYARPCNNYRRQVITSSLIYCTYFVVCVRTIIARMKKRINLLCMQQGIKSSISWPSKTYFDYTWVICKYIYTPLIIILLTIAVAKYRVLSRRDDFANR